MIVNKIMYKFRARDKKKSFHFSVQHWQKDNKKHFANVEQSECIENTIKLNSLTLYSNNRHVLFKY